MCLDTLELRKFARVIEPSAGGGSFSDLLFARPGLRKVHAFDLAPENALVERQDWFDFTSRARGKTLVVWEPAVRSPERSRYPAHQPRVRGCRR